MESCSKEESPIIGDEIYCLLAFDCEDGSFSSVPGIPIISANLKFPSWQQTYNIYNLAFLDNPKYRPWEIVKIESAGLSWKPGDIEDSLLKMGILEFKKLPDYHYAITLSEWHGNNPREFKISLRLFDEREKYVYWHQYIPGGEADYFFKNAESSPDGFPILLIPNFKN